MLHFVNTVTYSPIGDNQVRFETTALVGQASCLSIKIMTGKMPVHHFFPKYITEFMKWSTNLAPMSLCPANLSLLRSVPPPMLRPYRV